MTSQRFHFSPGVPRLVAQEAGRIWGGQTEHGWGRLRLSEVGSRAVRTGGTASFRLWAGVRNGHTCTTGGKQETEIVVVDCSVVKKDLGTAGLIETWWGVMEINETLHYLPLHSTEQVC